MKTLFYYSVALLSSLFLLFCCTNSVSAFNYTVNFTASGASSTIDKVIVQNLTQGTTVTVTTGNTLQLTPVDQVSANDESLHIYPNPIQDKATVSYYSNSGGNTTINVFGVDGRNLVGLIKYLNIGVNTFQLTLPKGAFAIQFNENGKLQTAKILSQSNNIAGIEFTGYEKMLSNTHQKAKTTAITMSYNQGDLILYKAYSGNYVTVLTDIATGSKTMNFNFVECKDADGNYYSTVKIGTQVWMGENLKTTKYNDGTTIPNVTNNTTWGSLATSAYCWYNNDITTYKNTYGALYNWYAVNSSKLAPINWHVPTADEWVTLVNYLGGNTLSGGKLKETGTTHWATTNTGATNETGFTAIAGGGRSNVGISDFINIGSYWWCSNSYNQTSAYASNINRSSAIINMVSISYVYGFSVRCILNSSIPVLPTLTTMAATNISISNATLGGNVTSDGGATVTERGVCISTSQNPTTSNKNNDGTGVGIFSSVYQGFGANTTYYVRAYAINSAGTAYGNQISFTTSSQSITIPTITTTGASSITSTNATLGGNVTSDGGASVTERGVCISTSQNPTTSNKYNDGTGVGIFSSVYEGFGANTTYYVRAYAINSAGTAYGIQISFTTSSSSITIPTVTTFSATNFTQTSATTGGEIIADGGSNVTSRGVCWNTSTNPTIANSKTTDGTGIGKFDSSLTGLSPGTTYYFRAYATNSAGTAYGVNLSFTTITGLINDNCAGAILIPQYGSAQYGIETSGDTNKATQSVPPGQCGGNADDDVWYKFVAMTSNPLIRVQGYSSGFGYDAVVELWSGGCNGNFIGCANSTGRNVPEMLYTQNLIVGTTYYIRVYGYYGNYPGLFKILVCSSVVSNSDECSGATPIAQEKYYLPTPGNSFISQSIPVGSCGSFADDDMWYKFVALTANPTIRVTGYGNYNPVVELRSGNCNGTILSCVNNTGKTGTEYINCSNLVIGSIYYVRVFDNLGIPGIFEIGLYGN